MNLKGLIPLCPSCKRPRLNNSQHYPNAYKCSYCHGVFPESWIVDYVSINEPESSLRSMTSCVEPQLGIIGIKTEGIVEIDCIKADNR